MRLTILSFFIIFILGCTAPPDNEMAIQPSARWTEKQANDWYQTKPWLVGANFVPSTAINQLEMWQAETFDTATISRELKWASEIGMNTMRVFLHDLAYQQDPEGFMERIDLFLKICERYGITPMFVLFDSCWDPFPRAGKQHEPAPFLHNSGWVQSPGADALKNDGEQVRLENYVKGIVSRFKNDKRVLAWDVWNEPDNTNNSSYGRFEPYDKVELVYQLLKKAFQWTRSAGPDQPVTAGIWYGNWSHYDSLRPMEKLMIDSSDIISFHNYDNGQAFEKKILELQHYNRPLLCTEYMSRGNGSTFQGSAPIAKKYKVGAYNWGLVSGKSQTIFPWDSWQKKYTTEPELWFHDVFRKDGTPFDSEETSLLKKLTEKN
jgi:hypothetical protein